MAEEKKEPWLNYLALTTVLLAVCATLSTFKGGGYSTRSLLNQSLASDQWAHYQSKSIKLNLYQLQHDQLAFQLKSLPTDQQTKSVPLYQAEMQRLERDITRYGEEKKEIRDKARGYEAIVKDAQQHGKPFGYAVIFLQVAILLSSIAGLLKKKALWLLAMPLGLLGLVYFADGFFLFLGSNLLFFG